MLGVVMVPPTQERVWKKFSDERLARKFFKEAKARFPQAPLFLISLTTAIPPTEDFYSKKRKGLWCPCCGEERKFITDSRLDLKRCSICGISERDFYVRSFNGTWPKFKEARIRRKKLTLNKEIAEKQNKGDERRLKIKRKQRKEVNS